MFGTSNRAAILSQQPKAQATGRGLCPSLLMQWGLHCAWRWNGADFMELQSVLWPQSNKKNLLSLAGFEIGIIEKENSQGSLDDHIIFVFYKSCEVCIWVYKRLPQQRDNSMTTANRNWCLNQKLHTNSIVSHSSTVQWIASQFTYSLQIRPLLYQEAHRNLSLKSYDKQKGGLSYACLSVFDFGVEFCRPHFREPIRPSNIVTELSTNM